MPASRQAKKPARKRDSSAAAGSGGVDGQRSCAALARPLRTLEDLGETARYSSSLIAGVSLLECFSAERPRMGIAELAHELRMSRPTVHRYAATLVSLGYLEQDRSRRYRLAAGGADVGLALLNAMPLRALAHEHLHVLRAKTGHTVALAVLDGVDVRFVDWLRGWRAGQYAINRDLGLGTRVPSHCTAMGKALLAYLPEHTRERTIAGLRLVRHGPNSITAKRVLRAELEHVRAVGLAVNDEELSPSLRTLAVPLLDARGRAPAAIGVAVPSQNCSREELVATLGPAVVAAATRIATVMRAQPGECVSGEGLQEGLPCERFCGEARPGS